MSGANSGGLFWAQVGSRYTVVGVLLVGVLLVGDAGIPDRKTHC